MPRYGIPDAISEALPSFLRGWDINMVNFEEIEEGYDNLNLLVTTGSERVVVRCYRFRNALDIPFELETVAKCREVGFPVAAVSPNKAGRLSEELNGKPAAVFEFVEGRHPLLQEADRRQIGQWLGEYHKALAGFRPPSSKEYGEMSELERAARHHHTMKDLGYTDFLEDLSTLEQQYLPRFRKASSALPHGVVHGDFYPGNLLIDGSELVALLDFDTCFWGTLVRDVADAVLCWSYPDPSFLPDQGARSEILEGYQRIRRLTTGELAVFPIGLLLACFSDAVRYLVGWMDAGDPRPKARDCRMYLRYKELEREFAEAGVITLPALDQLTDDHHHNQRSGQHPNEAKPPSRSGQVIAPKLSFTCFNPLLCVPCSEEGRHGQHHGEDTHSQNPHPK